MALFVYESTSPGVYAPHSANGDMSNPVLTSHHGRDGDTFDVQLFVGADVNPATVYELIRVKADTLDLVDDIGSGAAPGVTGWGVKMLEGFGASPPTEDDWANTDYGSTIEFSDILNNTTFRSFWYRIKSPRGESVKNKENIVLRILYRES